MSDSKTSEKKSQRSKTGPSRRSFLAASAAGAALPFAIPAGACGLLILKT